MGWWGGAGGGGGGGGVAGMKFKLGISLLGGFQKAEFRHEVEKFHPCTNEFFYSPN